MTVRIVTTRMIVVVDQATKVKGEKAEEEENFKERFKL